MIPRWRKSSKSSSSTTNNTPNNNYNNNLPPSTPSPNPTKRVISTPIGIGGGGGGGGAYQTLPHHYKTPPPPPPGGSSNRSHSNYYQPSHHHHNLQSPCQNFLLGGHYYPGKDKKTYQKTLWYRIFWSSSPRRFTSFLVLVYLLVWWCLVPIGRWLLFYGRYLSGHDVVVVGEKKKNTLWKRHEENMLQGLNIDLPSVEEERRNNLKLVEKQQQDETYQQGKIKALMEVVPLWFFRNDEKRYNALKTGDGDGGGNGKEVKFEDPWLKKQKNKNPTKTNNVHSENQQQINNNNNPKKQIRTLHTNLITTPTYYKSSCPSTLHSTQISTTLVIQSSLDRLWIVHDETCKRWSQEQPIILVVYVKSKEEEEENNELLSQDYWKKKCPQLTLILHHEAEEDDDDSSSEYPVNQLRNKGLDAVQTSHVLMLDVDLVPSLHLHDVIKETIEQERQYQFYHFQGMEHGLRLLREWEEHQAYVIPAFERLLDYEDEDDDDGNSPTTKKKKKRPHCNTIQECRDKISAQNKLPSHFNELKECVEDKNCIVFQSDNNWEGHYTTRSDLWLMKDWYTEDEDLFVRLEEDVYDEEDEDANEKDVDVDDVVRNNGKKDVDDNDATKKQEHNNQEEEEEEEEEPQYVHPKRAKTIKCFDSPRYEPYVVIPWCPFTTYEAIEGEKVLPDETTTSKVHTNNPPKSQQTNSIIPISPYYDERFYGYGKNKIQQVSHLRFRGYRFYVLPGGGFVIHHPHPESNVKKIWNDRKHFDLHGKMDELYPRYLKELVEVYGEEVKVRGMIPDCDRGDKKRDKKKKNKDGNGR